MVSYINELDINYKLNSFIKIIGIINNVFEFKKSLIKSKLKL